MEIQKHFRRALPKGARYSDRLSRELHLIEKNGFERTFLNVREILDLVPGKRHITRGSAGCSLVAYLLGIHNMDPVSGGFALSRFMHENRSDLPDVDLDFAYNERDEVVDAVMSRYAGRAARISNHVMFRRRSALRQALRDMGHRSFVPRHSDLADIVGDRMPELLERAAAIEGGLKNYSLHCGGVVIFEDGVPDDLKIGETQIRLNKDEVDEARLFKIDILCNRGLAQLNDLSSRSLESYPETDEATSDIFRSGRTWGITFGESPAQRRLYAEVSPRSRADVSFCLALIRPLPSADGRRREILRDRSSGIVYDDDGIAMIQRALNCSESEAELYRRSFCKKDEVGIADFKSRISHHPMASDICRQLGYFSLYSFCKAHARSYGDLVWALGYEKSRQPKRFWWSALNHAQSMYRPWVHAQEAKLSGLSFDSFGSGPWGLDGDVLVPSKPESSGDGWSQFERRGWWTSPRFMPGMFRRVNGDRVSFRGLIATGRLHSVNGRKITFVTVGVGYGEYLDVVLDGEHDFDRHEVLSGSGPRRNRSVSCSSFEFGSAYESPRQLEIWTTGTRSS